MKNLFIIILVISTLTSQKVYAAGPLIQGTSSIVSGTATQVQGGSTIYTGAGSQTVSNTSLCSGSSINNVNNFFSFVTCLVTGFIVPLVFTLAIVSFMWGVVQTLLNPSNEEARKKGKAFIMWGLISLFVIVSMWGIVKIFTSTFGLDTFLPPMSQ